MDRLFGMPPGTIQRATRDDGLMVDLAQHLGIDTTDAGHMSAADWLAKLAETAAAGTPAGRVAAPEKLDDRPELLRALQAYSQHTPVRQPSDLDVANDLLARLSKLHQQHPSPEVFDAVQALSKAIPQIIGVTVRDAEREMVTKVAQ